LISKVAVVKTDDGCEKAFHQALDLIGGNRDLDVDGRDVTIKIGVYDPRGLNHPSFNVVKAVVNSFKSPGRVFLAESDNYVEKANDRLNIWKDVFNEKIVPFNLSADVDTRTVEVAGERLELSHILFKPFVRMSLHAFRGVRGVGQTLYGSVMKNLLGVIPDIEKARFHEKLGTALVDILDGFGGVDLSVLDATYTYYGKFEDGKPLKRLKTDLIVVGRDIVAVDAVGFALVGVDPQQVYTLTEASRRGLGQVKMNRIEILGESLKEVKIALPAS
jgi:uncharacterized protein (DUF362 family)